MEQIVTDRIFFPIKVISWLISLPIRATAWVIETARKRYYDPEAIVCPGCGFRGDSGTNKKSCSILFVRVAEPHRAMIEHTCFRCYSKSYSPTFRKAKDWVADLPLEIKKSK